MTAETIIIRSARQQDINTLILLLENLFALEDDFSGDPMRQQKGLMLLLTSDLAKVLVAEENNKVIGMCTGQIVISTAEGGPALLVEDVVTEQASRRKGVGTMLLKHLSEWAKSQGISRMQLLADRNNSNALEFYTNRGWQTTQLICLRSYTGIAET